MRKYIFILYLITSNSVTVSFAQETDAFSEILTEITERTDNEDLNEDLTSIIYDLSQNPVNINIASRKELEQFFWLKTNQIDQVLEYREKFGQLQTTSELNYIPGFTEEEMNLLKHFIVVQPIVVTDSIKKLKSSAKVKQILLLRTQRVIEKQDAYREKENYSGSNYYTGNPWKYYTKYNISINNKFLAGITCEKDPGEDFFTGSNPSGFDFYSFHLQVNNLKFIKNIIFGDYSLQFGQGLAVNSKYSFGKSLSAINTVTSGSGISRYTSSDENKFFRGIASTLQWKDLQASLFYSNHYIDANIIEPDSINSSQSDVSSFQTTGIHGTPNEIFDEKQVKQSVAGTHFQYQYKNIEIGATTIYTKLSARLKPDTDLYNMFYFRGNENVNYSIDYRLRINNILFFGEEGLSNNNGYALLNGVQYFVGNRLGIRTIHRYYTRNYQSLFGNAFGENTKNQNEEGLFIAIECSPIKKFTLAAYTDFYKFPWLRYTTDMPSSGREYMFQVNFKPNTQISCYVQYRNKRKEENLTSTDDKKNLISQSYKQRVRGNFQYQISPNIGIQNRIEFSFSNKYENEKTRGLYISQDLNLTLNKIPVKIWLRYALFDTQGYDSRIYTYENDVLYTFSVPAFSGKGTRSYIMIKYSAFEKLDFWVKYSITQYGDKETVSSGLAEIRGNKKSEIRLQMLYKF